jgi:uncharacterized repeat protein (TIGR01451 family)
MRIPLLFLLSTLFVLSANAQIVNIPDANFKNALLNHVPVINTNNDGEIQVSEAVAFTGTITVISKNIADLTGINAFYNITGLNCQGNQLTSLSISGFNSLNTVYAGVNRLTSLSVSNLPVLQFLECAQNVLTTLQLNNLPQLQVLACAYNNFTSISFSGFPSLRQISIYSNSLLTDLTIDNLPNLKYLSCNGGKISNLTLTGLPVLDTLFCENNKLTSISLPNPSALKVLAAGSNLFTTLPTGLTGLKYLDVTGNQISNFPLDNMNLLQFAYVSYNLCSSFSLTNKPALKFIRCNNNLISNLQLSNLPSLESLDCRNNQLASVTLNGYNLLEEIRFDYNQLTSLTLGNLPSLKYLTCDGNKLATLTLSNYPLFSNLNCAGNQMTNLSLNNLPNLYSLYCNNNVLTSLPFLTPGSFPALRFLDITGNRMTRLALQNLASLEVLSSSDNPIDSIRLKNLPALSWMKIEKNRLTSLILDSLPNLRVLYCGKSDSLRNISLQLSRVSNFFCDSANITSLDISQTEAQEVQITNNPLLQYINMKNNVSSIYNVIKFTNNNLLQFICVDSGEKARVIDSVLRQLPGHGIVVSTICNFTPATSSTIKGTVKFDLNGNGCNTADSTMRNVRINNSDGIYLTSAFTNSTGQYIFHTVANSDTVKVVLEQPTWFNVSPAIQQVINIPNPGITATADFCVTANSTHNDLEVVLLPINSARPGFNAQYKIVYSNKGNQLQSGTVTLNFDAVKLNFLSALPTVTSQATGNLSWNYSGLAPYETRTITLTLHVNAPPVVNMGDVLAFAAVIDPVTGDETPNDNTFYLKQVVRAAFDPNDKDVTEGSEINISKAGDYLHYIILFQNTGNDTAINVIIKDSLANNLDWNSLVPVDASHPCRTVISKGNKVEFIFDNINLPDKNINEPASHGFVSFKIKPKSSVTVGEIISNKAEIYFDFNQPIVTNTVSTTIVNPKKSDNLIDLTVYSNPVKDDIRFTVKAGSKIRAVNVYNTVGEKLYSETVTTAGTDRKVNITNLPTGMLFLQVITNEGTAVQKVIRIK